MARGGVEIYLSIVELGNRELLESFDLNALEAALEGDSGNDEEEVNETGGYKWKYESLQEVLETGLFHAASDGFLDVFRHLLDELLIRDHYPVFDTYFHTACAGSHV